MVRDGTAKANQGHHSPRDPSIQDSYIMWPNPVQPQYVVFFALSKVCGEDTLSQSSRRTRSEREDWRTTDYTDYTDGDESGGLAALRGVPGPAGSTERQAGLRSVLPAGLGHRSDVRHFQRRSWGNISLIPLHPCNPCNPWLNSHPYSWLLQNSEPDVVTS